MTDRELMQQALDALETCDGEETLAGYRQWFDRELVIRAEEALRARLAQPEPEPVATQYKYIDAHGKDYWTDEPWEGKNVEGVRYLYASPPRKEWQGLTHHEICECFANANSAQSFGYARAIEAKLKEKNS